MHNKNKVIINNTSFQLAIRVHQLPSLAALSLLIIKLLCNNVYNINNFYTNNFI